MNIKEFVKKAIQQDNRNIFANCEDTLENVPDELRSFYSSFNPIDVEVMMNGDSVKFYPFEELYSLQEDYDLGEDNFVFSTCNSDPIFYNKDGIFTCCHGAINTKKEKLAQDFLDFLNCID